MSLILAETGRSVGRRALLRSPIGQARRARLTTHTAMVDRLKWGATIQANALGIVSVRLEQNFIPRHIEFSQRDRSSFGQEVVIGGRFDGEGALGNKAIYWFDSSRTYIQ